MAAELGLLSLTQLHKLSQSQQDLQPILHPNPSSTTGSGSWMWNPNQRMAAPEDDDSWEVRAFTEDTGNIMGTTWPPRSYTCTFCRREFRSAQALGGHMNVHRRDRARLHQTNPNSKNPISSSTLLIPTQELVANGGLCLLYSLPNPNGLFSPSSINNCTTGTTSTLLSISPYPTRNFMSADNCPTPGPNSINSSRCLSSNTEEASANMDDESNQFSKNRNKKDSAFEEIDLELRLGRSSSSPS